MSIQPYHRPHVEHLLGLISDNPGKRIIAMTGPRQTGKTTVAIQAHQKLTRLGFSCWYIPMDDPNSVIPRPPNVRGAPTPPMIGARPDGETLINLWEHARLASLQSKRGLVLFLDEIQLISRWSNLVKGLWDRDRREDYPLQVVILGSASWRMLTGVHESLVGRFDSLPITHWTYWEMTRVFGLSIEEYMFFGGYPGALFGRSKSARLTRWRRYIQTSILKPVIDRDIVGLERVHKPALMRQLIDLAPYYSGQLMSYNKLLGQLQDAGNTTTIARYLDLLSDAGLVTALSRYTPAPHLGRASSPKLNVLNTALMTAPPGHSLQETQADRSFWGRIVESAVGAHLYNTRDVSTRIHYWRDPPHEVDYVIARGPHLLGIEVKSGGLRSRQGLKKFEARFPTAKTMVVGPSSIPLKDFFLLSTEEWIEERCV
jgi:hypothetical protein